MYSDNDFRLYHHGILGQKWGVQNGPPYPIGASDHSASEKRAGWRKSLGSGKIESRNKRVGRSIKGAQLQRKIDRLERKKPTDKRQEKIDKLAALRDTKLSDLSEAEIKYGRMYVQQQAELQAVMTPAMILTGGGAIPGVLAAAGYYTVKSMTKSGKEFNREFKETANKVNEENKERIQNEKNKRALEAESSRTSNLSDPVDKIVSNPLANRAMKNLTKTTGVSEDDYMKLLRESEKDRQEYIGNLYDRALNKPQQSYYSDQKKYFNENKSQLLNNAKNNNRFDLEFLEITQNDYDDMSESQANKKILKDYEKYLDDPEEFTKRHYS